MWHASHLRVCLPRSLVTARKPLLSTPGSSVPLERTACTYRTSLPLECTAYQDFRIHPILYRPRLSLPLKRIAHIPWDFVRSGVYRLQASRISFQYTPNPMPSTHPVGHRFLWSGPPTQRGISMVASLWSRPLPAHISCRGLPLRPPSGIRLRVAYSLQGFHLPTSLVGLPLAYIACRAFRLTL